jgi:hypothetical protein
MKTINKNKQIIILLLLCFVLGSSCRKEYEVCIEGYVRSSSDSRAIEGATVRLTSHQSDLFGGGGGSSVQTQVTDASGKYKFTFKKSKNLSYRVSSAHPKYFSDPDRNERVLSMSKKQDVETLYLIPEAWVKLYAKRVSNATSCFFNTETGIEIYDTLGVEKFIQKYREASGSSFINFIVRYNSTPNKPDEIKKVPIILTQFDTLTVNIEW